MVGDRLSAFLHQQRARHTAKHRAHRPGDNSAEHGASGTGGQLSIDTLLVTIISAVTSFC